MQTERSGIIDFEKIFTSFTSPIFSTNSFIKSSPASDDRMPPLKFTFKIGVAFKLGVFKNPHKASPYGILFRFDT